MSDDEIFKMVNMENERQDRSQDACLIFVTVLTVIFLLFEVITSCPGKVIKSFDVTNVESSRQASGSMLLGSGSFGSSEKHYISLSDGTVRKLGYDQVAIEYDSDASSPVLEEVEGDVKPFVKWVLTIPDGYNIDGDESDSSN